MRLLSCINVDAEEEEEAGGDPDPRGPPCPRWRAPTGGVPFEGRGRHAVRTTGEGEIRRGGPEKRRYSNADADPGVASPPAQRRRQLSHSRSCSRSRSRSPPPEASRRARPATDARRGSGGDHWRRASPDPGPPPRGGRPQWDP
eukprot:EG_transcript_40459